MAQRLGISTATFSKYRSILKLQEELVGAIAQLLDENRISFEAAYRISQLTDYDAKVLVRLIQESSEESRNWIWISSKNMLPKIYHRVVYSRLQNAE